MSRKNVLVLSTKIMSIVTATCAVCIGQSVSAETNANTNDSEKINRSVLIDSKNKQKEDKQKEDKQKENKSNENKQNDKDKPKEKDKPNPNVPVKKMAELRVLIALGADGPLLKEDSYFGNISQSWPFANSSQDIKEAFSKLKFKVVDETKKSQEVGCKFLSDSGFNIMSLGEFDAGHTYTISAVNETVPSPYFVRYANVDKNEDKQFEGYAGGFTWDPTNGTKTQYTKALRLDPLEIIYAKDESVANKCFSYTQPKDAKGKWISNGDWQFKYNKDNIFARIRIKNNTISFPEEKPTKVGYVFDSWQYYTVPYKLPNGRIYPYNSMLRSYDIFVEGQPATYSPFDKKWTTSPFLFEIIRDNKGVNNWEDKCGTQYGLTSRTFVVFPKWRQFAKVTFKDGEKAYAIVEARVNKSINGDDLKDQSMPADPKKDGYKFTGWVDSAGKAFTGDTVVTGDMTVFSKYEEIVKPQPIAKVTFKDGDKAYASVKARVNMSINGDDLKDQSMPADPKKDGYKFTGWVDNAGKAFTGDTVVTGDMTVFSKYEEIVKPQPIAKVTFKDGDKAYAIVEARVNKSINGDDLTDQSMPADPKKDGYKFTGWVDSTGKAFTGDTVVTGDMTVFSKYEEIVKPQLIAKVTFKDGETEYAIVEARVNKSINGDDLKDQSMPADPKKDGYKFTGWVDGNGKAFNGDTVVTGDMTVFSKYEEIVKPQPKVEPKPEIENEPIPEYKPEDHSQESKTHDEVSEDIKNIIPEVTKKQVKTTKQLPQTGHNLVLGALISILSFGLAGWLISNKKKRD